jgi:hypothetical protein
VAHVRFDILQRYVTIERRGDNEAANCAAGPESVIDKGGAKKMAFAYCAGYAAMIAAGRGEEAANVGCDKDFPVAVELITSWDLDGGIDEWKAQAVDLMRMPKNVAAVAMVAERLMQERTLKGDVVESLVDLSDGTMIQIGLDVSRAFATPLKNSGGDRTSSAR